MDRVELFINLSDCQIVRFRHIGGGWAARPRAVGGGDVSGRAVGPDSSEAAEALAGWPLRLLPLPCGSWRMRSLLRWLINQFQLLVEQCSQSLKLTQYASKGQIIAKRVSKRGILLGPDYDIEFVKHFEISEDRVKLRETICDVVFLKEE